MFFNGKGLVRFGGRGNDPLFVQNCRDCGNRTTAFCNKLRMVLCTVCQHLRATRSFQDEPPTRPSGFVRVLAREEKKKASGT